jgi:integrase
MATADGKRSGHKRGDGEGSIRQRKDGMWRGEIMVGYRPDGKPDRRYIYAKTRKGCQEKLDDLRRRATAGLLGDAKAGRESVAAFLRTWLKAIDGTMEPDSYRRHRDNAERHLIPLIGRYRLADLRPQHIVDLLAALRQKPAVRGAGRKGHAPLDPPKRAGGRTSPKALSPRTVKYCYTTIRRALDTAVSWGAVPRNVARAVDPPKVPKVEIVALKPGEIATLVDSTDAAGDRLAPLYTLATDTGLRLGEVLGLRWADLDLDAGTLSVRRTMIGIRDGAPVFEDPKTPRSRRTLRIPAGSLAALRVQRDRQNFERQALGGGYADHDLVFVTPLGTPLDAANVLKRLRVALKRAGLPASYTFHSLRHSAATIMLAAGVNPKVAADRLGHASAGFTLDRYAHAVEALDFDAAERIQAAMDRARRGAV